MQDTFNKRDYMSVGALEQQKATKTLEMDDAGSVIMVRHGTVRMSPLRIDQIKGMPAE